MTDSGATSQRCRSDVTDASLSLDVNGLLLLSIHHGTKSKFGLRSSVLIAKVLLNDKH